MTLPELMFRIWDGIGYDGYEEFFTHTDMNRCEYNANTIAEEAGVPTVQFIEATRASQFRYDEAQRLEDLTKAIAQSLGLTITIEDSWGAGRRISYIDFERWESNLYACYQAMGGIGDRIESHKFLVTVHAVLFANEWEGNGPYHYDLKMPSVHPGRDAVVYGDHNATAVQKMAEMNAVLRAECVRDRYLRVHALSIRPRVNIPIKVTVGMMQMSETITLGASGWQGSGPWTQQITLQDTETVSDAILGICDASTDAMAREALSCGLYVSAISGTTITVTALIKRPSIDLTVGALYNKERDL